MADVEHGHMYNSTEPSRWTDRDMALLFPLELQIPDRLKKLFLMISTAVSLYHPPRPGLSPHKQADGLTLKSPFCPFEVLNLFLWTTIKDVWGTDVEISSFFPCGRVSLSVIVQDLGNQRSFPIQPWSIHDCLPQRPTIVEAAGALGSCCPSLPPFCSHRL